MLLAIARPRWQGFLTPQGCAACSHLLSHSVARASRWRQPLGTSMNSGLHLLVHSPALPSISYGTRQ